MLIDLVSHILIAKLTIQVITQVVVLTDSLVGVIPIIDNHNV